MRYSSVLTLLLLFFLLQANAQPEISTGYAVNKNLADGAPLQLGYDLRIGNKLYTKPQIGFKYLYHFEDFVGAKLKVSVWEIHQTISYIIISRK